MYCSKCGQLVSPTKTFCENCGQKIGSPQTNDVSNAAPPLTPPINNMSQPQTPVSTPLTVNNPLVQSDHSPIQNPPGGFYATVNESTVQQKNMGLALLYNLILPGFGHIYLNQIIRGLIWFGSILLLLAIVSFVINLPIESPITAIFFFAHLIIRSFDVYNQTKKINNGSIQPKAHSVWIKILLAVVMIIVQSIATTYIVSNQGSGQILDQVKLNNSSTNPSIDTKSNSVETDQADVAPIAKSANFNIPSLINKSKDELKSSLGDPYSDGIGYISYDNDKYSFTTYYDIESGAFRYIYISVLHFDGIEKDETILSDLNLSADSKEYILKMKRDGQDNAILSLSVFPLGSTDYMLED